MGEEDEPLGVRIGAREIYDEVVALRTEMRTMGQENEGARAELADHEERLRALERWRYALPISVITAIIGAVVAIVESSGKA
ncbi:hypothetical protein I5Q34_19805 [Streptomyces sp. AV19]|uniref:hypothetical protein n=1 Tax=Streptomyces sp. AV19 TaxID=2793068 RepID=UPI0018FEAEBF|nr:hypothetical protein [Streptomyces sp. AV19]MBH1936494.1 hypothetical protein [Streptomyces sp. AV19]MDG4532551.1 hypothetical protein [Streptomyces sp. AV19]